MAHKSGNPTNLESNDQNVNASACPSCDRPDWADDMVQCEDCEDWYHFSCAGVSPAVAKRRWVCDDCSPISVSSRSSSASKALELQRLQEEQQIRRRRFLQEKALEKKRLAQERQQILEEEELEKTFLQEKFNLLEMQEGTERGSVTSSKSRRSNHESIMQWMRNDGNNEPTGSTPKDAIKQATNPESVLHSKPSRGVRNLVSSHFAVDHSTLPLQPTYIRNAQTKVDSSVLASAVDQKIVPYLQPMPQPRAPFPQPSPRLQQPLHSAPPAPPVSALRDDASINVPPLPFEYASSEVEVEQRLRRSGARVKRVAPPEQDVSPAERFGQVPAQPLRYARYCEPRDCARTNNDNSSEIAGLGPTSTQIAARRVMSRDLPDFDGNPEDWPIFISQYEITTESCGFSNAENLVRLQRCLKGHARESVRSRLLLPASIPQVIETLRMLYGRPGLLITALLNRVRVAPAPRLERLETVIEFGMELQGLCDHLQASGETAHLNNPSLLQELEDKLPSQMKLQWAMHKQTVLNVTLQTFATYMSHMVTAASQVTKLVDSSVDRRSTDQKKRGNRKDKVQLYAHASQSTDSSPSAVTNSSTIKEANTRNCAVCDRPNHRIKDCKQFLDLNVENRWRCIHKLKLCRTCLNAHGRNRCRLSTKCGIDGCEFKHHPLLHSGLVNQIKPITAENHSHRDQDSKTLFRVVPVTLTGRSGKIQTYAFLDDGSDLTLMEKSIAQELGESGPKGRLYLNWTSNVTRCEVDSEEVSFGISGLNGDNSFQIQSARTVSELKLPIQSLNMKQLTQQYPHLKGLPISGYEDAVPRILIGLDQLNLSLPLKCREGRKGDPVATKTRLGWCVYGGSTSTKSVGVSCHIMSHPEKDLHDVVKYYFAQEDTYAKPALQLESAETTRARKILSDTTVRLPERFETGLLWRFDHFEFPESYTMALRRLESLERKMSREPLLKASVFQQIREYQEKGYAHRATEEELLAADPRRIWYLPIGVVTNPKKPGKVRLIWDAAAKVDGISLNSVLLKGPDLLNPLPGVLFRFREKPVAISGDIREMFHQLRIRLEDRHAQRFLMRENPSREPDIYLMDVATFGSSCSPCSAQFIKNRNAEDFVQYYPRAVEGITKCHYVDDYLDSFDTVDDAQRVAAEVKMIHAKGGFEIRGWRSNSPEVLMHLGETTAPTTKDLQLDNHGNMERVLGMLWLPTDDVLGFSTQMRKDIAAIIEEGERPTKRQVLRCVMSLFDPLGLLAMYTVHGKILIQSIWRSEKDWDEKIGDEEFRRWIRWISVLNQIDGIRLPRCYIGQTVSSAISSVQLHLFVDASEEAYAAAAYFRFTLVDGTVMCNLIAAKTKVAPLKPLSIPRLELQAAVLGTRLASFIGDNHTISIEKRVFWSDSSTVLAWIRSDARRYRQYVACRVGEILTITGSNEWKWVPSKMNPADEATKWGNGPHLSSNGSWFQGPEFLNSSEQQWPLQERPKNVCTEEELRSCFVHGNSRGESTIQVTRFSCWSRLLRATAYMLRFINNCRRTREQRNIGLLGSDELRNAENVLWKFCQAEAFPNEISLLKIGKAEVEKSSPIFNLSPYLDEFGILRQNGRIGSASNVGFNTKYPIILLNSHPITVLLLDHYHRRNHHANFETVVNEVRQNFYIGRLRGAVRKTARTCQWCKIYKSQPSTPKMAPLPAARLASFERPFSYVGVDFFGPILVKVGRSHAKRWVALFTCLTIRAVHLEVAYSLSTESCITCFRRFVARRGAPLEVYSDNGTNFQGAEKQLREQISNGLADTFTNANTKWFFNPPSAPHMGGVWERMVRSVKVAIENIDSGRKLHDEGLLTLLAEAESMVNSRPLTYLPLDSEEQEALTPNHFLLGSTSGVKQPPATPTNHREAILNNWKQVRHQSDLFWHRWLKEYLPTICRRTKWFSDTKPIELGDLVLVAESTKRNSWMRGRVTELQPGPDGRIRQAIVQTSSGFVRRPVCKLALLDVRCPGKTAPTTQCYGAGNVAAPPGNAAQLLESEPLSTHTKQYDNVKPAIAFDDGEVDDNKP